MIARFRRSLQMSAAGLLLGAAAPGAAFAQSEGCTPVTTQSLAIPGLVIAGSNMQEASSGLPKHCIVSGEVNDRTGADGKHYAIGFELRLPVEWNGRFLDQTNGGNDGVVLPATGDQPKALASGGVPGAGARLRGSVLGQRLAPKIFAKTNAYPDSAWNS